VLRVEVLGNVRVAVDGVPLATPTSEKARLVLGALALDPEMQSRQQLAERYWGFGAASARNSLAGVIKVLRAAVGEDHAHLLSGSRSLVGLPPAPDLSVDVREFLALVRGGDPLALELWRGDFLQGCSHPWLDERRSRLRAKLSALLGGLSARAHAAGDLEAAVRYAREHAAAVPRDAYVAERLFRLLRDLGDPVGAQEEYMRVRRLYEEAGQPVPPRLAELRPTPASSPHAAPPPEPAAGSSADASSAAEGELARPASSQAERAIEAALDRMTTGGISGVPTGLADLDEISGGLPRPGLTVAGGRPGTGTTTFALTVATAAALDFGIPTVLFTPDLDEVALAQRLIAMRARLPGRDLSHGRLEERKWPRILETSQRIAAAPLYVDDSSTMSLDRLRAKLVQLDAPPGLCVIDELNALVDASDMDVASAHARLFRALRRLSQELDVAVLATIEVSPAVDRRFDKRPTTGDVLGYEEIGARADLLVLLHREEMYDYETSREGELDLIVADNRRGPVGDAVVTFQPQYPSILNYAGERFTLPR
jgi:DNA-binding SARP family transcriptional activator/RecA/RadA recombinase